MILLISRASPGPRSEDVTHGLNLKLVTRIITQHQSLREEDIFPYLSTEQEIKFICNSMELQLLRIYIIRFNLKYFYLESTFYRQVWFGGGKKEPG